MLSRQRIREEIDLKLDAKADEFSNRNVDLVARLSVDVEILRIVLANYDIIFELVAHWYLAWKSLGRGDNLFLRRVEILDWVVVGDDVL